MNCCYSLPVSVVVPIAWTGLDDPALLLATILQLYLTPGKRLPSSAVFIVYPGVRIEGEGMSTGSSGWQDRLYPVSSPLVIVGACHEKLRLVVVIDVIWNILGGPGATGGRKLVLSTLKWKALKCQTLGTAVHDCTCVLTRNQSLSCDFLILAMQILFCFCIDMSLYYLWLLPVQSSLTSFWRCLTGLVQLIFSFRSWFHTIWFYCFHMFHRFLLQITFCFSFGSKGMITVFTCLPSYRYSSFTLRVYLCWRHTYSLAANDQ